MLSCCFPKAGSCITALFCFITTVKVCRFVMTLSSPAGSLKPAGMPSPHRRCTLIIWLGGLASFLDWNNQSQLLGGYHTQDIEQTQHSETQPDFLWKRERERPIFLSFSLRGRLNICHTPEAMEVLSGNVGQRMPWLYSPLASLQLTSTYQKIVYTLVWSPEFHNCHLGDTFISPGLEDSRA